MAARLSQDNIGRMSAVLTVLTRRWPCVPGDERGFAQRVEPPQSRGATEPGSQGRKPSVLRTSGLGPAVVAAPEGPGCLATGASPWCPGGDMFGAPEGRRNVASGASVAPLGLGSVCPSVPTGWRPWLVTSAAPRLQASTRHRAKSCLAVANTNGRPIPGAPGGWLGHTREVGEA